MVAVDARSRGCRACRRRSAGGLPSAALQGQPLPPLAAAVGGRAGTVRSKSLAPCRPSRRSESSGITCRPRERSPRRPSASTTSVKERVSVLVVGVAAHPARELGQGLVPSYAQEVVLGVRPRGTGVSHHDSIVPLVSCTGVADRPDPRCDRRSPSTGSRCGSSWDRPAGRASPGRRGGRGRAGARSARAAPAPVQRLDALVRPVLAVAEPERWCVGQQDVDGAARPGAAEQPAACGRRTGAGCTGAVRGGSARSRRDRRSGARPPRPRAGRR